MKALPVGGLAVALCAATGLAFAAPAFTFALIGDLGYSESNAPVDHERQTVAVLDDLNANELAFVIHDGDLGHPREMCADQGLLRRLAQFQALAHPLIYTPGDNEWMDCGPEQRAARLQRVRELFFPTNESLGRRTLPLIRQSDSSDPTIAKYRENARWQVGEVTFFTVHIVGSGNGAGTPEYRERDVVNRDWMQASFAAAKAARSRAVMLVIQANVFPGGLLGPGYSAEFFDRLWDEVLSFGRPVVLVHGDSHHFRIDKPLVDAGGRVLENFTRVETSARPIIIGFRLLSTMTIRTCSSFGSGWSGQTGSTRRRHRETRVRTTLMLARSTPVPASGSGRRPCRG